MSPIADSPAASPRSAPSEGKRLRVRTITAGLELPGPEDLRRVEVALDFLVHAKIAYESAGYEVQTVRVATNPWVSGRDARAREALLPRLRAMDDLVASRGAILSIGPVLTQNRTQADLAEWASELVGTTRVISFSVVVASPEHGVHGAAAMAAAETMLAVAKTLDGGVGNFRFAAAANIPAGTPFFPVAWHRGAESFAVGLESASVVEAAFQEGIKADPTAQLRERLDAALEPVDRIAGELARRHARAYLGIDTSPAPGKDRSIAAAIEALLGAPFGSAGTLEACATVTAALKAVKVATCGYSGLMLPVLEDPLLAQRAGESRYTIRDLLLYSSVCGTGLDVVPIPGDTPAERIAALLRDVGTLSTRLRKPLSARLFIVPGKKAGEIARFTDPLLTDCVVMKLD